MRQTSYVDVEGRRWAVLLPDGVPDTDATMGIPLGPPSLLDLSLPPEIEVRLHNQLFDRRIFTATDAKQHRQDIVGALMGALRVDAESIVQIYLQAEPTPVAKTPTTNGKKPSTAAPRGSRRTTTNLRSRRGGKA